MIFLFIGMMLVIYFLVILFWIYDLTKAESAGCVGWLELVYNKAQDNPMPALLLALGILVFFCFHWVVWKEGKEKVDFLRYIIQNPPKGIKLLELTWGRFRVEYYENKEKDEDVRGGKKPKDKDKEEDKDNEDKKAQSPLDQFSIVPFFPLPIGNLYFSFTNASFFLLLTLIFVLFSFHLVTKKGGGKLVPNACQSVLELIYDFVPNLVNEQIGGLSGNVKQQFFPCISVTFTFSLFRNLQGMIPYSFTVTSHFIVTLGLSFSLFIGITIVGFSKNGLHFLSFSLPAGVPLPLAPFLVLLELIPHCFRALSLGIRLFANMMAGHSLVKILSGFAWTMLCMNDLFYFIGSTGPFFIVLALTGLELGVAILQAYVFTILICIYLNDAINLH